jgi:hypothetical protein
MPERDDPGPSHEVAGEDFLFHLHRGSELLQDNRVHAAKAELEQALSLQPSDPKGQDLLGIVYFRLGLYPRAIAIYERLIQAHPEAVEPRINLALSYLKTGQPSQARFELEKALEQNPKHQRAWGYLGLAFQRMGDFERASQAFAAGGHDAMARRLLDMTGSNAGKYSLQPDNVEQPAIEVKAEVRRAAGEGLQALDRSSAGFRPDSDMPRIPSGTWSAIEPGRETIPTIPAPPPLRSLVTESHKALAGGPAAATGGPGATGAFAATGATGAFVTTGATGAFAAAGATGAFAAAGATGAFVTTGATGAFAAAGAAAATGPSVPRGPLGAIGGTAQTIPSMPAVQALAQAPANAQSASARRVSVHDEPALMSKRTLASLPAQSMPTDGVPTARPGTVLPPSSLPSHSVVQAPESPFGFARERLLVFPRDLPVAQHVSGVVLVQAGKGFATRLDGLRSLTVGSTPASQVLKRHARGRTFDEPLGGPGTPLVEISGRCDLVIGPPSGRKLHAVTLGEEPIYLREDVLAGFELTVSYENGRLPAGDGDAIAMVQLRGRGSVIMALPERTSSLEITTARSTSLRAGLVLGWMGRLLPRTLPPNDAPAAAHGFVTFGGEGMVLIDGR